jgi:hypothetical protein
MTENPEASVLTATRAAQHFTLFRANEAYEHWCILTVLRSLVPLHLMLADTPWPHGFGATLTNVGGSASRASPTASVADRNRSELGRGIEANRAGEVRARPQVPFPCRP